MKAARGSGVSSATALREEPEVSWWTHAGRVGPHGNTWTVPKSPGVTRKPKVTLDTNLHVSPYFSH